MTLTPAQQRPIRAAATLVAVVASFVTVYAFCKSASAQPGPAILSAILAISLSRREGPTHGARILVTPFVIAGTALVASGVGWLLLTRPLVGASVFVAGVTASIWLRNFGERARSAGALIALPFVGMLVAPARADAPGGVVVDIALVLCAGVVSFAYVTAVQWFVARADILPSAKRTKPAPPRLNQNPSLSPATRMALQMAVALSAAFVAGFAVFPAHWGWTVLTAFIVISGARGRGDAAHKAVLRLIGAVTGTLAAGVLTHVQMPGGAAEAALIFTALFFGLWLRDVNYAYWAGAMTLVLALLSRPAGAIDLALLGIRLEAIFVGALCGVAAAWFVLPIRTEAVIRRRLADALAALDEIVDDAPISATERADRLETFEHRLTELDLVAPPVRLHRRIFARGDVSAHPASWIDLALRLRHRARVLGSPESLHHEHRASVRRAIRTSRRAIADHAKREAPAGARTIGGAMQELHDALDFRHATDGEKRD